MSTSERLGRPTKRVVLDAFIALSGADQDTTLPDTGDIEADLKAVLRATAVELVNPRFDLPSRALTAESQADPATHPRG